VAKKIGELKQGKGEPLEHFIERVVAKWEKAGKIEVDDKTLAVRK
jgi:hypothetical protein